MKLKVRLKGGPGSGHHGHAGRPGKVGGSAPGVGLGPGLVKSDTFTSGKALWAPDGTFIKNEEGVRSHTQISARIVVNEPESYKPDDVRRAQEIIDRDGEEWGPIERVVYENGYVAVEVNFMGNITLVADSGKRHPTLAEFNSLFQKTKKGVRGNKFDVKGAEQVAIHYDNSVWSGTLDEMDMISGFSINQFGRPVPHMKEFSVIEEKQLPIDDAAKRNLFQVRLEIFYDSSDALAEQVFTGDVSIADWESAMRSLVKEMHTSAAAIGKGGWDNVSFQEWGRLGTPMRQQYKYLNRFAQDIADQMDDISVGTIRSRARMYGRAAGYVASLMQAPKEILSQLPWIPKDGSTECLSNCKCVWLLKVIDKIKAIQTVQATWWMRVAEHCSDCPERNGHIETFEIDAKVQVPAMIGGF